MKKISYTIKLKTYFTMLILFIGDILSYYLALFSAYFTRDFLDVFVHIPFHFSLFYLVTEYFWIPAILIIVITSKGLYSLRKPFWHEVRRILFAVFITFLFVFTIVSLGKLSEYISRLFLILLFSYTLLYLIIIRFTLKSKILNKRAFAESLVVVGAANHIDKICNNLYMENGLCFYIKGIVLTNREEYTGKYKMLGYFDDLEDIIIKNRIASAFIIIDDTNRQIDSMLNKIQLNVNKLLIKYDSQGVGFSNTEAVQLLKSNLNYIQVNNNFKYLLNNIVKRFYDIILSIILLPLLLIIFFIIALFIKLTSKGPVFYGHNRVGRYGKTIKVLKFRSMYQDADVRLKEILENNIEAKKEWETYYKLKDDPRVTPIGKFLRKTSLDELPQIFNVIKGDMSFVGPRPVIQDEIDKYYKELASYYYMVRPGITGLWQISGRNDIDYDTRVAKDSWYVLNWSVWLDIVILFKTPGAVLQKKGAY